MIRFYGFSLDKVEINAIANICSKTKCEVKILPEIYSLLDEFVNRIGNSLNINYKNPAKLRIMIHVECAVERMILNNGLK